MLLKDFYGHVILTEETAVALLRENNLLDIPQEVHPGHRCGSITQEKRKRHRSGEYKPVFRCPRKACQIPRSVLKGNLIFHYTDINNKLHCNLSLCEILELVFFFVVEIPMNTAVILTGKPSSMITSGYNVCREVCGTIVSHRQRGKIVGTNDNSTQVDAARFADQRKYNRGRMVNGANATLSEDSDADAQNNGNHGRRIDDPWVFALKQASDCRYFYVERCDRNTLLSIIVRDCEKGSMIHSDESPAYGNLNAMSYRYFTVNHQEHYVAPVTDAHTQAIE